MQELVELLASLTGEALFHPSGLRRFGRHAWKSTGTVELAALNLELWKIQLLARWASPLILHYARLAPLAGITQQVKELTETRTLGKLIEELRQDMRSMKETLPGIDENTKRLLELEIKVADELGKMPLHESSSDLPVVKNCKTNCHHWIAVGGSDPAQWTTACTFEFAQWRHERLASPPLDYRLLCPRCFPELRGRLKRSGLA